MTPMLSRRNFARNMTLALGTGLTGIATTQAAARQLHLSCNQYVWYSYYQRERKELGEHLDEALAEMTAAGLNGIEPSAGTPADLDRVGNLARKHRLELRSLYVNSTLHEPAQAERSVAEIQAIARAAKPLGTRIIVTNPNPIRWGGPENKNDAQLECQAAAMNQLGKDLDRMGLQLAYHNHDIELRQAAREFHHMMAGTNPRYVHLCLDAHWIYRGAGNSQVALFDVAQLYGPRIAELHLRQSKDGVWTETLEDGDLDYPRLVDALRRAKARPHLVLEQAVEQGTPHTLPVVEAIARSVAYVRRVFAPLA